MAYNIPIGDALRMRTKVDRLTMKGTRPSKVEQLAKNPRLFLETTTTSVDEFYKLKDETKDEAGRQHYQKHKQRKITRKYGAGRPHILPYEDRLCAALMVMRGVIKGAVAQIFDVSEDTITRAFNEMLPVLVKALKSPGRVYWHATHAKNGDIRDWIDPDKLSVDALVINTSKPSDKDTILLYSRRGKGTGYNVVSGVDGSGQLAWVSAAEPASFHDTKVYGMHANPLFMALFKMMLTDRGLIGAEKDKRVNHVHGIKRRPRRDLAEGDRKINSWINSEKYQVEQVNSFIKNFWILHTLSWKDREKLNLILQGIGGLINFRLECRKEVPLNWGHKSRPKRKRAEKPEGFTIEAHMERTRGKN